jgi:hypothetical protein
LSNLTLENGFLELIPVSELRPMEPITLMVKIGLNFAKDSNRSNKKGWVSQFSIPVKERRRENGY